MISFDDITKLFAIVNYKSCIEIEFRVSELSNYQNCWMGKTPKKALKIRDRFSKDKEVYWFGLTPDGSKAYDYNNYFDFSNAPVFDGKSLKEIWYRVELLSVDGCEPEARIKELLC